MPSDEIDVNSLTWQAVREHCLARIKDRRDALELTDCDKSRGEIRALRAVLELSPEHAKKTPELVDEPYADV